MPMSTVIEEEMKRWTARRKSQLVLDIIQTWRTLSEAGRQQVARVGAQCAPGMRRGLEERRWLGLQVPAAARGLVRAAD